LTVTDLATAELTSPLRGLTVADAAARYRVSPDKVRSWIRSGELFALNTSSAKCAKPRFVIPPDALERFERGRAAAQPKPAPRRRRKPLMIDYLAE
jgi:hypothetical protein